MKPAAPTERPMMHRPTLIASLLGGLLVLLCAGYFVWRALRG